MPRPGAQIARDLGIEAVRKLRFEGSLSPIGRQDWALKAKLGATVVQSCVVTLAPVSTRIEEELSRRYIADYREPESEEAEIPEDLDSEPLPSRLDLALIMTEALAIALPDFPRAPGAELGEAVFTEPGAEPLTEEKAKPFAGLADLKKKLEGGG